MNNKRNYYLLLLIMFCQGFVFYGPIATLYREARGLTMYQIFLIESIFMIMMIVTFIAAILLIFYFRDTKNLV